MEERNSKPARRAKAGILAVVFLTATNSVFFKLSTVPAMVFVSLRFLICALVFLLIFAAGRRGMEEKTALPSGKTMVCLFLTGFVFSIGAFAYFVALKETALSSVLILNSSNAIFVVIFSTLFLRERVDRWVVLAIFVTMCGCTIVFLDKTGGTNSLKGNLCAVICAICAAIYMVVMKHFSHVEIPVKLCTVYSGSFLFALVTALIQGHSFLAWENGQAYPIWEYIWILGAGIIAVCIPQSVINWALRYIRATFAGNVALLEPIIGTVYGFFVWGDALSVMQIFGGVMAIGGLYLYGWSENRRVHRKEEDENE